jgi:hypothetical protein
VRVAIRDGRSRPVHVRRQRCTPAARNPAYSWRDSSIKRVRELHWVGRSRASGEVLPGPRTWKASRGNGEANQVVGAAWKRLEGAGHGGRGSKSLAGGGAACSGRIPVIFGSGMTCEHAGRYGQGSGLVYRHGTVHERPWTGERARACTGERGCANGREPGCQPRSNT